MEGSFKNTFPLDGKIKLAVASVSKNGRKKWFLLARKSVSTSRNQVIFQKSDSPFSSIKKKYLNKLMVFQLNRKLVSTSRNGKNFSGYASARRKNCFRRQEYIKNQIKWLPIIEIRVLNRFLYNLNNGFH